MPAIPVLPVLRKMAHALAEPTEGHMDTTDTMGE